MTNRSFWKTVVAITIVAVVFGVISPFLAYFIGDGIVEDKVYAINATYKTAAGRQFDFKDRNIAHGSITVPLADERGIPLVREDRKLPPSTVVKMHIYVKARVMEKVKYPAHDYIEWHYNLATVEPQVNTPSVTLRK